MSENLQRAERIARLAHAGQVEQWTGQAYIEHVERVVARVSRWPSLSSDVQAVAWLHDVLEDTAVTVEDLALFGVSTFVVQAVQVLSRKDDETYAEYIERVKTSKNAFALAVKLADLGDHLRAEGRSRMSASMVARYKKAVAQLTEVEG